MPTSLDIRKMRCLDGLHYSFQLLKHYHSDLWKNCCDISADNSQAIPALASCWGFVDALHRIREIAQSTPGLGSKHHEMRQFLSATALAEEYRHYIQHLRGELAKEPPNTFPVWGALSWVDKSDNKKSHTAILGVQVSGTNYSGCVFDTVKMCWVSNVCLGVNNHSFNFDPIFDSALRFEKFIIPHLLDNAPNEVKFHEKLSIVTASFVFTTKN